MVNNSQEQIFEFKQHLLELRQRLIYAFAPILIVFLILVNWAPDIFHWVIHPLKSLMPKQSTFAIGDVMGSFLVPIKLTFIVSVLILLPWILYQLWLFIAPGLYKNEKKMISTFTLLSYLFFMIGMLFAYFVVCPMVFKFVVMYNQKLDIPMLTDARLYLDFTLNTLIVFGIAFELPVLLMVLVYFKILDQSQLVAFRRYAIVISFVIAAIVTPPDPFSQIAMAIPLCLLYELGIIFAKKIKVSELSNV
jgi:sec-independent protein translocase protein TatC